MSITRFIGAALVASCALFACTGNGVAEGTNETQSEALAAGSNAAGSVPASLPSKMMVGLFENLGGTWLKSSGSKWDMRYAYFGKGWLNRWGYGPADGQSALDYMNECNSQGFIPVIQYYMIRDYAPAGDESKTYAKTQDASIMADYWSEWRVMMQRAKQFGKPVVFILEGDGFGYLEMQTQNNPNAYAAIAASGTAELAGMPNTVAGFGMSFLQMRKAVGANNALLGPDVPIWATGADLSYYSVTEQLQPHVDKFYGFLAALGLGANQTGATFDFTAADPLDADSDWWRLVNGVGTKWWDASDTASIYSASFNRYAEWLRLWNVKSGKRWFLWQVPVGNSNHLNVWNNGQARQGYKDNRAEYFFGPERDQHLAKFADAGVMGLLFGQGEAGTANYTNDQYTDGQLFMNSRAGAMENAGGFAIARTGGTTTTDAGAPPPVDAGTTDSGSTVDAAPPPPSDPAQYGFESGTQGWASSGAPITGVAATTAQASAGTHSLAVNFNGAAGAQNAYVANVAVPAGKTITFHVYCPAGSAVSSVQPYALQGASGGWAYTGNWKAMSSLKAGAWNALTVTLPPSATSPLAQLGVQFSTNGTWAGTCYVDSVGW